MSGEPPGPSFEARVVGHAEAPPTTVIRDNLEGGRFDPPSPDLSFESVNVREVDFSGMRCWRLTSTATKFINCSFDRARIEHGPLSLCPQSTFTACSFRGVNFRGVDPGHGRFVGCSFEDVRIEGWFAYCAEFVDCVFSGTIRSSRFSAKPIECAWFRLFKKRLEFSGNDFRAAVLIDTEFAHGIALDSQLLPEGDEYLRIDSAMERIDVVRSHVREWPNPQAREEMLICLDSLADTAEDQADLFVRRDVFDDMPTDLRDELWAMLNARNGD